MGGDGAGFGVGGDEAAARERAARIRREREARSLPSRELAERVGMPPWYLNEVENGERVASPELLDAIQGALDAATVGSEPEGPRPHDDLAERRKALGATQEEVARRAGISYMSLGKIETGWTRNPRPTTLAKIDQALDELAREGRSAPQRPYTSLREDLRAANLTARELAKYSGVSESTIFRILSGETAVPSDMTKAAITNGFEKAEAARWAGDDAETAQPDPPPQSAPEPIQQAAPEHGRWVPVDGVEVHVPDPPAHVELPAAPELPPHLEGLGAEAAYLDASARGYAAGARAGADAAAHADVPWEQQPDAAAPIVRADSDGQKLAEARRRAAAESTEPDQDVGVSWAIQDRESPAADHQADELRAEMASAQKPSPQAVHSRRHSQAAANGYEQGWVAVMTARALDAAGRRPELVDRGTDGHGPPAVPAAQAGLLPVATPARTPATQPQAQSAAVAPPGPAVQQQQAPHMSLKKSKGG